MSLKVSGPGTPLPPVRRPDGALPEVASLTADRIGITRPSRPLPPPKPRSPWDRIVAWWQGLGRQIETLGLADRTAQVRPVHPLPGGLDRTPLLQSNHPEILRDKGIALSTLPWPGEVHLKQPQSGAFGIFAHHNNRSGRTLQQSILLQNPGDKPVSVTIRTRAVYTTPEAPYRDRRQDIVTDPRGSEASGPGDATASAVLRQWIEDRPVTLVIPPGGFLPLSAKGVPQGAEITSRLDLETDGPVHAAVVFSEANTPKDDVVAQLGAGRRLPPNPGDKPPTPPGAPGPIIFGRVAGIQEGRAWQGTLTQGAPETFDLTDSPAEKGFLLIGKATNTLGTDQDQAAPLPHRYADAAFRSHGNYGVLYDLGVPLRNPTARAQRVAFHLDTPTPAPGLSRAFRGTLAFTWTDADGKERTRYVNVNQRAGEDGSQPLVSLDLPPGTVRSVQVRFVYPANATPPHVLRIANTPA